MSADLYLQAVQRFHALFARAQALDIPEPAAMSLATANAAGRPSVRTVLLKQVDERGFVFYTNLLSRKGAQLRNNPHAALCFFWQPLMEQVLVEGSVAPLSETEADTYWATRQRISQIGAWASRQSEILPGREHLEQSYAEFERKFAGGSVPRPPYWSGYRVVPDMIEFWSSRPGRLHERKRYFLANGVWQHTLIYP
ncbi:MAG: pyridoxamine 5'-phosphate oxidase [Gammaproteobacteria bacterium]